MRSIILILVFLVIVGCKQKQHERLSTDNASVNFSKTSDYMSKEDEIYSYLLVNEIPEDFPKYIKGENETEYKKRCILWAKENLELIKPKHRQKVRNYKK
ncbi:hypothetical protein [Mesonia aquimarina]|uniref:hypothetical protein n=1 Tax=Mesonia aquimarina TaxID=1504967 RepID=UPI000EF5BF31|nr:hypothetical protein [Mesonia aquimarina]